MSLSKVDEKQNSVFKTGNTISNSSTSIHSRGGEWCCEIPDSARKRESQFSFRARPEIFWLIQLQHRDVKVF